MDQLHGPSIVILLGVTLGVFLIAREIVMWYWKINQRIDNQQKILEELKSLRADYCKINKIETEVEEPQRIKAI